MVVAHGFISDEIRVLYGEILDRCCAGESLDSSQKNIMRNVRFRSNELQDNPPFRSKRFNAKVDFASRDASLFCPAFHPFLDDDFLGFGLVLGLNERFACDFAKKRPYGGYREQA